MHWNQWALWMSLNGYTIEFKWPSSRFTEGLPLFNSLSMPFGFSSEMGRLWQDSDYSNRKKVIFVVM